MFSIKIDLLTLFYQTSSPFLIERYPDEYIQRILTYNLLKGGGERDVNNSINGWILLTEVGDDF